MTSHPTGPTTRTSFRQTLYRSVHIDVHNQSERIRSLDVDAFSVQFLDELAAGLHISKEYVGASLLMITSPQPS